MADAIAVRAIHLLVAGLFALSVFGAGWFAAPHRADAASVTTTVYLNLRTGPSLGYRVITVMPPGSPVITTGAAQNGFYPVIYQGISGWAYGSYLNFGGSSPAVSVATFSGSAVAPASGSVVDTIYAAAARYGQSGAAMLAVARCESSLNPGAVNRSSGASGLFQFMPGTWRTTPYAGYSVFNTWANANAAAWMWSVGRRGEWAC